MQPFKLYSMVSLHLLIPREQLAFPHFRKENYALEGSSSCFHAAPLPRSWRWKAKASLAFLHL